MGKKIKTVKKPWQKPELVVLVRGNPEESVLTSCKVIGSLGYHNTNNSCLWSTLAQVSVHPSAIHSGCGPGFLVFYW